MSLVTRLTAILRASLTGTSDLSTPTDELTLDLTDSLATGTGLDQSDLIWHDQRTLATVTSEAIDLAGSLTNAFGGTVTFARIKGIIIQVVTATAGYKLEVGGAAANQFINWVANSSDIVVVRGGGFLFLWAPDVTAYAVTAGTGDQLKINNPSAGSVVYNIILIGSSV